MKIPYNLAWDNTPVVVTITDGSISQQGEPNVLATYTGKCNYSERKITTRTPDGVYVSAQGASLRIGKDIAPTVPMLSGHVVIGGKEYKIVSAFRPRNTDGTVHHTTLEVM